MHIVGADLVEEDSVTAAHAGLSVPEDVPGEPQARTHVVHVVEGQLAVGGESGIFGEEHARYRIRVHHGPGFEMAGNVGGRVLMKLLVPGEEWLPTHAHREIEAGMNFEFVLSVEEMLPADRIAARLAEDHAHRVERSEQEIGVGVARTGAGEGCAAGLGELVVEDPVHVVHFIAPLEGMSAADPAHGVAEMPVLILLLVRVHGAEIEASLCADGNSLSVDAVRNGDSQALRSVLLVGIVQGLGVQEIERRLIQQGRAERVGAGDTDVMNIDATMAGDKGLDIAGRDDLAITVLEIMTEKVVLTGVEKIDPGHVAEIARGQRTEAHDVAGGGARNEAVEDGFRRRTDAARINDISGHARRAARSGERLSRQPVGRVP